MKYAIHFKYNELALTRLKKFVKPSNMRWLPVSKEWVMDMDKWEAFLETLYDANLAWRELGFDATEICAAFDVLRSATVRDLPQ